LSNPDINPDKSKSTVAAMDLMARGLYRFVVSWAFSRILAKLRRGY